LEEEAELQPEWAATLAGIHDSAEKLARKDEELAGADAIFVASSFTRKTLLEANLGTRPVYITPYGSPVGGVLDRALQPAIGQKLRVLFVGSLGQRKGLSYLIQAVESARSAVELTLIGRPAGEPCAALRSAITRYRHIPSLPHDQILAEMQRHDVFVFPSLFEGFGLVLLEAMSQGLPVITTANTAGPDIITEGQEGFIVPIRSAAAIAERLVWLADHRLETREMGQRARQRAAECTWENYGAKVVAGIQDTIRSGLN
jgi:glycosyltransferase involved in cell wall biosynthesis